MKKENEQRLKKLYPKYKKMKEDLQEVIEELMGIFVYEIYFSKKDYSSWEDTIGNMEQTLTSCWDIESFEEFRKYFEVPTK